MRFLLRKTCIVSITIAKQGAAIKVIDGTMANEREREHEQTNKQTG